MHSDKKQIFGWAMYDWANSAFVTTVGVAILPIYFADVVVPQEGFVIGGTVFSAATIWGYMLSFVALLVFLLSPVLGAIADYSASKKKFMLTFCYGGSLFAILLYFCGSGEVWQTMIFFVVAQFGFVSANVFYDAFLPHIAQNNELDWVSGKGYAYGYVGGGLQFACSLGLIVGHESLGISEDHAARLALLFAGLWWAGFTLFTVFYLKEGKNSQDGNPANTGINRYVEYIRLGLLHALSTVKKVKSYRELVIFLIAFMIYNDGIQTVISMGTIYGRQELQLSPTVLMITLLIIQFIAFFGALLFGKLGERISSKHALMITLALWSCIVIYAYFMTTANEYMILGVTIGFVMGGSQALSRSLYSSIVPIESSAEFFGFYSVFNKFSSIWGPFVFAFIGQMTGSLRNSIVSLVVFFVVGMILLMFVNTKKAREAGMEVA